MQANHAQRVRAPEPTEATDLRAFWQTQLERFAQTGGTRKAFCRSQQLNYDQFQYWYHKLREDTGSGVKPIPVRLTTAASAPVAANQSLCTLELPDGRRLHVHDWALVDRLLARLG